MTLKEFERFIESNDRVLSVVHGPRIAHEGATYYALWTRKGGCSFPPESWDEPHAWVNLRNADGWAVRLDKWLDALRETRS